MPDIFDEVAGRDLFDEVADGPDQLGLGQELRGVGRAVQRGALQGVQALDALRLEQASARPPQFSDARRNFIAGRFAEQEQALYGGRPERLDALAQAAESTPVQIARQVSARQGRIEALPAAPDLQNLRTDFWRTLATNPVETIATVVAESLPQALPGMVGAVAGAGPLAVGANSFGVEYANSLLESAGPDVVRDPESLARWFAVPANQAAAKAKAVKRGLPVAAFDAATAGLAGRFLKPALGTGTRNVAVASGKELGTQMAGGMAGETAGQLASEGRITSVPDIVLEGIAELGGAPAEVLGNVRGERARRQTVAPAVLPAPAPVAPEDNELPDFRETAAAVPASQFRIPPADPGRPLDVFDTLQGAEEAVPAEGFTPVDRAVAENRMQRVDPAAGLAEAVPAEGWTPIESEIRRQRLMPRRPEGETPPAPAPRISTAERKSSQEFDRLLAEVGPELGWMAPGALLEGLKGGLESEGSIKAKVLRGQELNKARRAAASLFGVDPDNLDLPGRAALLPQLQEYIAQEVVPRRQAESLTAAIQPEAGKQPVSTSTLNVGDVLNIDGERVRVEAVDPDTGEVTLQDGTRFGRTTIADGQTLYVENVEAVAGDPFQDFPQGMTDKSSQTITGSNEGMASEMPVQNEPTKPIEVSSGEAILVQKAARAAANTSKWPKVERAGYELVFKAYGPDGSGYYLVPESDTNSKGAKGTKAAGVLDAPESVADQRARQEREAAQAKAKADREKLAERQAKPLTGSVGDIGQGDLLGGGDLFSARKRNTGLLEAPSPNASRTKRALPAFSIPPAATLRELLSLPFSDIQRALVTAIVNSGFNPVYRVVSGRNIAHAAYNGSDGVLLNKEKLSNKPHFTLTAIAHEAVHAATHAALKDPKNRKIVNELGDLMSYAMKQFYRNKSKFGGESQTVNHAFKNLDEFVTGAFTSKRFRNILASIELTNRTSIKPTSGTPTVLGRFFELVSSLLGLGGRKTLLEEVIRIGDQLIASGTHPDRPLSYDAVDFKPHFEGLTFEAYEQDGQPGSVLPAPSPTDKAIAALESLKVDTAGKVFDAIQGIPVAVWNGALSAAQLAIRAGQKVAAAIEAALAHIRAQHRGDFDEAAVRAELENSLQQRQFAEQIDAAPDVAQAVKDGTANRFYTRKPNEDTAAFAGRIIAGVGGPQNAVAVFTDATNGLGGAERTMLGQLIVKQLSAAGQHEAAARFLDDTFLPYSTEAAQALQAFAAFANLTPEGALIYAKRLFNRTQRQPRERIQPTLDTAVDVLGDLNRQGIESAVNDGRVQEGARVAVNAGVEQAANTPGTDIHTAVREHVLGELGRAGTVSPVEAERLRAVLSGNGSWREVFGDRAPAIERTYVQEWRRAMKLLRSRLQAVRQKLGPGMTETVLDTAIRNELRAQRIRLGRLVREHFRTVDAVGQSLTDRLVSAAGLDPQAAAEFARIVQRRFGELVATAKQQAIRRIEQVQVVPREVKQSWQRLVELSNLGALDRETAWSAVAERLKLPQWTPEIARETQRLAQEIAETPEGIIRQRRILALHNYLARATGVSAMDTVLAFWYANTLSGPTTQAVNLLANVQNLVANLAVGARSPQDFVAQLAAVGRGLQQGGREGAEVLRTGILTRPGNNKLAPSRPLELLRLPGRLDYLLTPFRLVGRALAAGDSLFFHAGQESRAVLLARQIARADGLSGPALHRRVAETLGRTSRQRFRAVRQAVREGLSGPDLARRVDDLTQQQRPEGLNENARDYALRLTFNQKPYGLLGAIAQGINWAGSQPFGLPLRLVVPFTNVVANVANESLNYVPPIGTARALWGHWKGTLEGQPITDRNALGDQWAKAALGTVLLGTVWAAAESGMDDDDPWFMVNGAGPRESSKKNQLRASGWIPFSLKLGGRYVSFANSPVAMPLAAVGNYFDARRYRQLDDQDAWNRVAYAFTTMGKVILEQSFLDGIARIVGSLDRDNVNAGKQLAQSLGRTAGNFVIPNAVRQVDRFFDPTVYDAPTTESALINSVPFARRQNRPALNVWGAPVRNEMSKRFASTAKPDPLLELLARRNLWVSAPSPTQTDHLNGQPMTPDEFYEFTRHRGQILRRLLATPNLSRSLETLPDDAVGRLWQRIQTSATTQAKAKVLPRR